MEKLSLKNKACVFISLALALMSSAAEREYFTHDWRNVTWGEARNHCQVCFKELVTVTPENIQTISQNLTFDYWVGLRKNLNSTSNSTSNSSMPWSRWANGDPLTFQNWYPGWPVLRSSLPRRYCCSCPAFTTPTTTSFTTAFTDFTSPDVTNSTELEDATATDKSSFTEFTTPGVTSFTKLEDTNANVTDHTGIWGSTTQETPPATAAPSALMEEQCVRSVLPSDVPEDYIEDSCVAMLSFGAWVERDCSELLSFICYEDRFIAKASVTEITSESTVVTWQPVPGVISHYLAEVKAGEEVKQIQTKDLSHDFGKLTAGALHSVQVFPVKCGRRLNPQEETFYTRPNKVEELRVCNVTETSVFLSWNRPAGNVDFYLVEVQDGKRVQSNTEGAEVNGLIPGNLHVFTVLSGVRDNSTWSEGSNITAYTKPRKVTGLKVTENTNSSLLLSWTPPEGNTTGFWVTATNESNDMLFNEDVSETKVRLTNLTAGNEITLSVTALTANNTLRGDKVTVVNYTVPGAVSDLTLVSTYDSINATWKVSSGNSSFFTVELQLENITVDTIHNLKEPNKHFGGLKTAAKYTVNVYSVSGHLKGPAEQRTGFTRPLPPTNASVVSSNKSEITLQWTGPDNISAARYSVRVNSAFWSHSWSVTVLDKTTHTFHDLKPGTRYDFEVQTMTNGELSSPAAVSHCTDAEKREISLSMMCSSAEPLLCDQTTTRDNVFDQLHNLFNEQFGNSIFWKLEKQETENK